MLEITDDSLQRRVAAMSLG